MVAGAKPFDQLPVNERTVEEFCHVCQNPRSDGFIPDLYGLI